MLLETPLHPLSSPLPLVLDLDGTLLHTDTFHEMMVTLLINQPWILFKLPFWFLKGRAYTKAKLTACSDLNLDSLPYNKALLAFAEQARQEGRPLILATGTDQKLAQKISDHLGIFQKVLGSDGKINMTGKQKGFALVDHFGIHGFDYAGDSPIDEWIWKVSHKAIVVYPKWGVLKKARFLKKIEHIHYFPREKPRWLAFIFALRPLFWGLNMLSPSLALFMGLSSLSSGLLILGDLLVLEKERQGENSQKSVFAKGDLHLITAFKMALFLSLFSTFFLFSNPKMIFYTTAYIFLFMGLDRVTRSLSQSFRWAVLALFQLLILLFIWLSQ